MIKKLSIAVLLGVTALFISSFTQKENNIKLKITGIKTKKGSIRIAVFKDDKSFQDEKAFKEMLRATKCAWDTRDFGLKMFPLLKMIQEKGLEWILEVYSDSDYAGDPETRISVTGHILFLLGVPIVWKSKAQKSVTLSSAEAEFVAMSEAVKEILFVVNLLESMGVKVKKPVIVKVDNQGAIFMAENVNTSQRTKHADTRAKFVTQFVGSVIKIVFVSTVDNRADVFTKNVDGGTLTNHCEDMIELVPEEMTK